MRGNIRPRETPTPHVILGLCSALFTLTSYSTFKSLLVFLASFFRAGFLTMSSLDSLDLTPSYICLVFFFFLKNEASFSIIHVLGASSGTHIHHPGKITHLVELSPQNHTFQYKSS